MNKLINRICLPLLFISIFSFSAFGQVAEWIVPEAGMGIDVCMDQFNNSFTCGQYVGTTTIGSYTFVSAGAQDVVIEKYDPSGTLLWATGFGGIQSDYSQKITYDNLGGIWVTGQFSGTMVVGTYTLVSAGGTDVFLVKLDAASGAIISAQNCGNSSNDVGISVIADQMGDIYLAGSFNSTFTFGSVSISGLGTYEVFLVKLTNAGVPVWGSGITGTSIEAMWSMAIDDYGNSYIGGYSSSTTTSFNGVSQSLGTQDHFIAKFDNIGNNEWITTSSYNGEIDGLCADALGNVYFTGNFDSQAVFDTTTLTANGMDDIMLGKINSFGAYSWVTSFGGGGNDEGYGIACTAIGDVFVVGTFQGNFNIGSTPVSSGSFSKSYILKANTAGTIIWAQQSYGSAGHISQGVSVNNTDDIFLTGSGSGTFSMGGYSSNLLGSYLVKLVDHANIIEGTVFTDLNGDALLDSSESGVPNVILQLNNGPYVTASNSAGIYNMYTISGNHSVTIPNLPMYYTLSTPIVLNVSFAGMGNMDTANHFGLVPTPNMNDFKIDITPITSPKAGHVLTYLITYTNQGTTTQNATVTLQADVLLSYLGASPSATNGGGQTSIWNLGALNPQANGTIFAQFNIPSNLNIGDLLQSVCTIDPSANDQTQTDNSMTTTSAVVGPYDPNYKEVNIDTLYDIVSSDWLEYTIHFQNIGNDTAYNVIVIDTLSQYLDLSTFEIISKSHQDLNFSINHGNVAEFRFNNIMLPDSITDPIGSNGFIKYRVKYLSTFPLFDSITNFADIYFDYNSAVRTNAATTYHSSHSLSVSEIKATELLFVYPNPVADVLNFKYYNQENSNITVRIFNVLGKLLSEITYNEKNSVLTSSVETKNLANGIYFIEFFDGISTQRIRFLKQAF